MIGLGLALLEMKVQQPSGVLFCPSKSTADWGKVWAELGGVQ